LPQPLIDFLREIVALFYRMIQTFDFASRTYQKKMD